MKAGRESSMYSGVGFPAALRCKEAGRQINSKKHRRAQASNAFLRPASEQINRASGDPFSSKKLVRLLLEDRRASRVFSEVGQIAPQAPVGHRSTFHLRSPKTTPMLLRAPREAGIAEQLPLPFDPSIRGRSGFWILEF